MKKWYEAALILIGTLGWWGFVYPELALSDNVYEKESFVQEEIQPQEEEAQEQGRQPESGRKPGEKEKPEGGELTDSVRKPETVRIKSRLFEYVCQIKECGTEKEAEDDR